eukprot:scaffold651399_cov52-Prasinocladus_malaysianus.AAC.1
MCLAVVLEQQYPGLALGEAVSQAWLKDHLCPDLDPEGRPLARAELPADALVVLAAALMFWYLRG